MQLLATWTLSSWERPGPALPEDRVPEDARWALTPGRHLHLHLHLGINVAGGFPRAAPAHSIEGYGFVRLVVDGVGGLGGQGPAESWCWACVGFGGQQRFGGDGRLGSRRLGGLGE